MADYIEIERLPLQWRSFFPDGEIIDLYENTEATLLNNLQLGQEDKKELDNYLKYTKRIHRFTEKDISILA